MNLSDIPYDILLYCIIPYSDNINFRVTSKCIYDKYKSVTSLHPNKSHIEKCIQNRYNDALQYILDNYNISITWDMLYRNPLHPEITLYNQYELFSRLSDKDMIFIHSYMDYNLIAQYVLQSRNLLSISYECFYVENNEIYVNIHRMTDSVSSNPDRNRYLLKNYKVDRYLYDTILQFLFMSQRLHTIRDFIIAGFNVLPYKLIIVSNIHIMSDPNMMKLLHNRYPKDF